MDPQAIIRKPVSFFQRRLGLKLSRTTTTSITSRARFPRESVIAPSYCVTSRLSARRNRHLSAAGRERRNRDHEDGQKNNREAEPSIVRDFVAARNVGLTR